MAMGPARRSTFTANAVVAMRWAKKTVETHSHSIILKHANALILRCNFFLRTLKNHLPDRSEICALEFKGEFRGFGICTVSATIGIDWSIILRAGDEADSDPSAEKTVSH